MPANIPTMNATAITNSTEPTIHNRKSPRRQFIVQPAYMRTKSRTPIVSGLNEEDLVRRIVLSRHWWGQRQGGQRLDATR
jgi:hypothetical protein